MSITDTITCHHGPTPHPWEPDRYCPPEAVGPSPNTRQEERLLAAREAAAALRRRPLPGVSYEARFDIILPLDGEIARLEALVASERDRPVAPPLTKDGEIAFRKDWDARVVPSPGTSGIRHPSNAPTIIGSRPRTTADDSEPASA